MAKQIVKIDVKALDRHVENFRKFLAWLAAGLAIVIPNHPLVSRIMVFVAASLALVSAKHIHRLYKWVKKWLKKGKGKFRGVYVTEGTAETDPPTWYAGTATRRCKASRINCGSPHDGRHQHEIWP